MWLGAVRWKPKTRLNSAGAPGPNPIPHDDARLPQRHPHSRLRDCGVEVNPESRRPEYHVRLPAGQKPPSESQPLTCLEAKRNRLETPPPSRARGRALVRSPSHPAEGGANGLGCAPLPPGHLLPRSRSAHRGGRQDSADSLLIQTPTYAPPDQSTESTVIARTSNCEPRRAVLWKTTVRTARSASAKGTLKMRTGRTFSTIPQSNSQTSPRLGGTFFLVEDCGQLVSSTGGNIIVQRTGIPRREEVNDLPHKFLLFLNSQCFELGEQFCCSATHAWNLPAVAGIDSRKVHCPSRALGRALGIIRCGPARCGCGNWVLISTMTGDAFQTESKRVNGPCRDRECCRSSALPTRGGPPA